MDEETTEIYFNFWIDMQTVMHSDSGILLIDKNYTFNMSKYIKSEKSIPEWNNIL